MLFRHIVMSLQDFLLRVLIPTYLLTYLPTYLPSQAVVRHIHYEFNVF